MRLDLVPNKCEHMSYETWFSPQAHVRRWRGWHDGWRHTSTAGTCTCKRTCLSSLSLWQTDRPERLKRVAFGRCAFRLRLSEDAPLQTLCSGLWLAWELSSFFALPLGFRSSLGLIPGYFLSFCFCVPSANVVAEIHSVFSTKLYCGRIGSSS